jgi:hypothetical protein
MPFLSKCAGVLGQAEPCEPIGYFLHRRLRPAEFRPCGPTGWAILPDRSRRAKPSPTFRRGGDGRASPKSHRRKPAPSTPRPAAENAADANLFGASHSGCSGPTNRLRAPCSRRRDRTWRRRPSECERCASARRRGLRKLRIEVSEEDLRAIAKRGYAGAVTTDLDQQAQAVGLFLTDALLQT